MGSGGDDSALAWSMLRRWRPAGGGDAASREGGGGGGGVDALRVRFLSPVSPRAGIESAGAPGVAIVGQPLSRMGPVWGGGGAADSPPRLTYTAGGCAPRAACVWWVGGHGPDGACVVRGGERRVEGGLPLIHFFSFCRAHLSVIASPVGWCAPNLRSAVRVGCGAPDSGTGGEDVSFVPVLPLKEIRVGGGLSRSPDPMRS